MGKPFADELNDLPTTYQWASNEPIDGLQQFVRHGERLPLYAVGSGGSLTAAYFLSLLHQNTGTMAKAVTPLELSTYGQAVRESSVMFLTSGGGNPDVLSGYTNAAKHEPRQLAALCMRKQSPLLAKSNLYGYADVFDYELPAGKDGFLATNSLLASLVLCARAYANCKVPLDITAPVADIHALERAVLDGRRDDSWLVLFGGWGMPVAMDIESKFSEAALGHALPTDYRNFAHGRHHWLAKRGSSTSVIAISTPDEEEIAEKTLRLLPKNIPVYRLRSKANGPMGSIDLFVQMLYLVQSVGKRNGIDPGKPGVPEFGRRIYNMRYAPKEPTLPRLTAHEQIAIERKCHPRNVASMPESEIAKWRKAVRHFQRRLNDQAFSAIVLDYDGTLCDPSERFGSLRPDVLTELYRLLNCGLLVGIATGRGRSARKALLELPTDVHDRVYIGYHNCGEILSLGEAPPESVAVACDELHSIVLAIDQDGDLPALADKTVSYRQVTFEGKANVRGSTLIDIVRPYVRDHGAPGCEIVASSHSVDIIAPGVSKVALVNYLQSMISSPADASILCIGDKGRWPGNDYLLLREPFSLSVDEVSTSADTCWNIAPAGHRGVQAVLGYFSALISTGEGRAAFRRGSKLANT